MGSSWKAISLLPLLAGIGIFLLHWIMEWTIHSYLFLWAGEMTEGLLLAMVSTVILVHIQILRQGRRRQNRRRLEAVASLNHHVRNALQVISVYSSGEVRIPAEDVQRAIDRIVWILRDVEPHLKQPQGSAG